MPPGDDYKFVRFRGPPSRKLVWVCIVAVIVYQFILMTLWVSFPAWDWFLLRISLSFADIISVLALGLGLYAYWLQEKNLISDDVSFFQETVYALRRAGLKPAQVGRMARLLLGATEAEESYDEWLERLEMAVAEPVAEKRRLLLLEIVRDAREAVRQSARKRLPPGGANT